MGAKKDWGYHVFPAACGAMAASIVDAQFFVQREDAFRGSAAAVEQDERGGGFFGRWAGGEDRLGRVGA